MICHELINIDLFINKSANLEVIIQNTNFFVNDLLILLRNLKAFYREIFNPINP